MSLEQSHNSASEDTNDILKREYEAHSARGRFLLKKQQIFDSNQVNLQAGEEAIKAGKRFDSDTHVKTLDDVLDNTLAAHPQTLDVDVICPQRPTRGYSWLPRLSLLALLLLVTVQTGLGLRDAWLESPWLFSFYGIVLALVSAWAAAGAIGEYRKLKRLKQVADTQAAGARLAQSMQMGEADSFIDNIVSRYPNSQGLQRLRQTLKDDHNDAEKVLLFEELVVSERDELAKKIVRRYAAESAILLAASPLAALDMAIILWRNQRMLRDVASCYGIELGYWSRIKLIRSIIINILYAGTSELVTDLGTQLLSVEMTGKLSARIGQGLGGGLLTARLGYQAMALCRPIAFREGQRPKLSKVHQELLVELKQFMGQLLTKDGRDGLKKELEAAGLKTPTSGND